MSSPYLVCKNFFINNYQPYGQHQNQFDYILCSQRWRSSIQSAKTRLGADCGSDHELLIAKFRLKLKKVVKTIRPFRYDLNQIPYDYTVEVRKRFKGLDLIECLMNYGMRFVTLYRRQGWRQSPWKRLYRTSQNIRIINAFLESLLSKSFPSLGVRVHLTSLGWPPTLCWSMDQLLGQLRF